MPTAPSAAPTPDPAADTADSKLGAGPQGRSVDDRALRRQGRRAPTIAMSPTAAEAASALARAGSSLPRSGLEAASKKRRRTYRSRRRTSPPLAPNMPTGNREPTHDRPRRLAPLAPNRAEVWDSEPHPSRCDPARPGLNPIAAEARVLSPSPHTPMHHHR